MMVLSSVGSGVRPVFIRLGMLNVRRQLARSLLVVLTMALAAISLTYSLSYQEITPPVVAPFLGKFAGGEILVLPLRWAGQQTTDVGGRTGYRFFRLQSSEMSWLEWFYPELYEQGFWAKVDQSPSEFFAGDVVDQLRQFPGVAEVAVTPMLPAVLHAQGKLGGMVDCLVRLTPATDRLRQVAYLQYLGDLQNPLAGLLLNANAQLPAQLSSYRVGDRVQFWLPRLAPEALPTVDYAAAAPVELPLASSLQIPTRSVSWWGPGEELWDQAPNLRMETGKFTGNLGWVSPEQWTELLKQVGISGQLPVANLALKLDDPQQLAEMIVRLGQAFPQLTFINMQNAEDRLLLTGEHEYFRRAPQSAYAVMDEMGLVVPASVNRAFGILFLLTAALLLGGHMLTNAAARHQEIGTLRALGARRRDILALGLSEAVTLTTIGVSSGFLAIRLFGAVMELRGGQGVLAVLGLLAREYLQVLGLAVSASCLFAYFPVRRLSTLSPMEVLRGE